MLIVSLTNFLAVLFAYQARNKKDEVFLKFSFIIIFLFLALRYNYGNDYVNYLEGFYEINDSGVSFFSNEHHFEPGWFLLCRLFEPLGFFAMVAVLAAFNCFVYYRFIHRYVPQNYYWLAVFLYVFNPQIMLVHSSAMRQSLAIAIFLFAFDYLSRKDIIKYFACISIAVCFHTTAVVLLPFFIFGLYNLKIKKRTSICIFSLFIFLFVFSKSIEQNIGLIINIFFEKYSVYNESSELGTGFGLIFNAVLLLIILHSARPWDYIKSKLAMIAIIGYLFLPLGLVIMMLARVGMYFQPFTLAVFPIILSKSKSSLFRTSLIVSLIAMTMYLYTSFFKSEVWIDAFATYTTIFSSTQFY